MVHSAFLRIFISLLWTLDLCIKMSGWSMAGKGWPMACRMLPQYVLGLLYHRCWHLCCHLYFCCSDSTWSSIVVPQVRHHTAGGARGLAISWSVQGMSHPWERCRWPATPQPFEEGRA